MTRVTGGRHAAPRARRSVAQAVHPDTAVRLLAAACAGIYAVTLGLPWLRSDLGAPMSAGDLPVQLPGLGRPLGATWSAVVIILVVAHAGVAAAPARHRAAAARAAAALSVTALCVFLLLGAFTDYALRQQLLDGQAALDTARRILGYRIPRPSVTTLGPVELPASAAALVSALRTGFLLALVAAVLSVCLWVLIRRGAAHERAAVVGWTVWLRRTVLAALAIVLLVVGVQAWRATWLYDRATAALAEGHLATARADVTAAIGVNDTLRARPDVQQMLADIAAATATGSTAQQLYGRSILAQDAGRSDDALDFAVRAAAAVPGERSYGDNVCRQAASRAATAAGIDTVRSLVPVSQRCDLTLLQLAATELTAGRYDLVLVDAGQLSRQTPDEDLRSAAFTMLARARLATGDLLPGRRLLQQALAADPKDLNVVARALASGIYSAARG